MIAARQHGLPGLIVIVLGNQFDRAKVHAIILERQKKEKFVSHLKIQS
jgi:hypothetical protein